MGCDYEGDIDEARKLIAEIERRHWSPAVIVSARRALLDILREQSPLTAMNLYRLCRARNHTQDFSYTSLQVALTDLITTGMVSLDTGLKVSIK